MDLTFSDILKVMSSEEMLTYEATSQDGQGIAASCRCEDRHQ